MSDLQDLMRQATKLDFLQTMREIENAFPKMPRIGESKRAKQDAVRFAQAVTLAFPISAIASFGPDHRPSSAQTPNDYRLRLAVHFLGLFGPQGALPTHLTEHAIERKASGDETFIRFADIFHHRMLSLFYRAWAVAQPTVQFDRKNSDRFSFYVGALCGLGEQSVRDADSVPGTTKLAFAGRLACQSKHAEGLEAILATSLRVPVRLERFQIQWLTLPRDGGGFRLSRMSDELTRSHRQSLGNNTVLGHCVADIQSRFKLTVGPLSNQQFVAMQPTGSCYQAMQDLVRLYTNDQWDWCVELIVKKNEVPTMKLGENSRLGWTTWIGDQPRTADGKTSLSSFARVRHLQGINDE